MKTAYGVILALIILLASCKGSTSTSPPRAWVVSTLAGDGTAGNQVDTATTTAQFNRPSGVAVDKSGNVYVADINNNRIRMITPGGEVSNFAGSGTSGDQDGAAASAQFGLPAGVAVDSSGNVYVAEYGKHRIRKITEDGGTWTVKTIAGDGTPGHQDNDKEDTADATPRFNNPNAVAVDSSDNVYVAEYSNNRIRKITETEKEDDDGNKIKTWTVSTIAGSSNVNGYQDGVGTEARFNRPSGVAVDSSGIVYVADTHNNRIRKITEDGGTWTVKTIAGGAMGYQDGVGTAARFKTPQGMAVDLSGNVYVGDTNNNRIRKMTETEKVDADGNKIKIWKTETIAGSGTVGHQNGVGTAAQFYNPNGVAVDSSGNVYVADTDNHRVRKVEYRVP